MTSKPSGLYFFNEVVIHESYSPIRNDLQTLKEPLIIDCGANCGAFALWALSVNPQAQVISFEPGEAFENLAINRRLYSETHGDHWQVEKCALSSKNGSGHFTQEQHSSMGHLMESGPDLIPMRTIDDLGLSPQILKIDVEGHELEVLKGSKKALTTAQVVILECHGQELQEQCTAFLSTRHFAVKEECFMLIGRRVPSA